VRGSLDDVGELDRERTGAGVDDRGLVADFVVHEVSDTESVGGLPQTFIDVFKGRTSSAGSLCR
jgi:hypothetical protein